MISRQEALLRVDAASLLELLHPRIDPEVVGDYEILGRGFAASPGAAVGEIVLDADEARKKRQAGEPAVLVAGSLGPDDKEGMLAAVALVTGLEWALESRPRRVAGRGHSHRPRVRGD